MKVLIVGAGVIGLNLAHYVQRGNEVTVLARGLTHDYLSVNGSVIKDKFHSEKTVDRFHVIDELKENDYYDFIFVCVRCSQLDSVLPMLKNNVSKTVVFVGNNVEPKKYLIEDKDVLFAFFSAGGEKKTEYIDSVCLKRITIGTIDGDGKLDLLIKKLFAESRVKVTIENHMEDWLLSHAAGVLPCVFASYYSNGDLTLLKHNKPYTLKMMDATKELYDVLKADGYNILPKNEYENTVNHNRICAFVYRFMFGNWIGRMCISGHAMHAKEEFLYIMDKFEELKVRSGLSTPNYDELAKVMSSDFIKENNND